MAAYSTYTDIELVELIKTDNQHAFTAANTCQVVKNPRLEDFSRHNPIDRWWGGTHLTNDNLWRWSPALLKA